MSETSPLQKQDITPVYHKLDKIIKLLEKIAERLAVESAIKESNDKGCNSREI